MFPAIENAPVGPIMRELQALGRTHGTDELARILGYLAAAGVLGFFCIMVAKMPARLAWLLISLPFRRGLTAEARQLERMLSDPSGWRLGDRGKRPEVLFREVPPVTVKLWERTKKEREQEPVVTVGGQNVAEHLGRRGRKRLRKAAGRCKAAILAAEKEERRRQAALTLGGKP